MKWMIASDLHGSAFYCKKMIKAFERERADRLLLLGDLLYHGPRNDLPEGYAPKEVIPLLNGLKPALLCVRGNCDAEVDQMVLDFPILADYAVLPAASSAQPVRSTVAPRANAVREIRAFRVRFFISKPRGKIAFGKIQHLYCTTIHPFWQETIFRGCGKRLTARSADPIMGPTELQRKMER